MGIIVIFTVVLSGYFTILILYLKHKIVQNSKDLNNTLMDALNKKHCETENALKRQLKSSEKCYAEFIRLISEYKESVLSSLHDSTAKTNIAIKSNTEQSTTMIKSLQKISETNLHQEEELKKLIVSCQKQEKSINSFSNQFNILEQFLTDKTELMHQDCDMMIEMLKVNWLNDLNKDMEKFIKLKR